MNNKEAQEFLEALLGKQLRIYTTDSRMFIGEFKCTDNVRLTEVIWCCLMFTLVQECNIILSMSYEHRPTTPSSTSSTESGNIKDARGGFMEGAVSRRFMGLIVVPGQYITAIEVEDSYGSVAS